MDGETVVDRLVDGNVVRQPEADSLSVTSSFTAMVDETVVELSAAEDPAAYLRGADVDGPVDSIAEFAEYDPSFLAQYRVLSDRLPSLGHQDRLRLALVVDRLNAIADPPAGVPTGFLPVSGPRFVVGVRLSGCGLGYVWQPDCDPCVEVRDSLARLVADHDRSVGALAVDGSQWPDLLFDQLGIRGAPTTLFLRAGQVDARLESARPHETFRREFDRTLEGADTSTPTRTE